MLHCCTHKTPSIRSSINDATHHYPTFTTISPLSPQSQIPSKHHSLTPHQPTPSYTPLVPTNRSPARFDCLAPSPQPPPTPPTQLRFVQPPPPVSPVLSCTPGVVSFRPLTLGKAFPAVRVQRYSRGAIPELQSVLSPVTVPHPTIYFTPFLLLYLPLHFFLFSPHRIHYLLL